MAHIDTVSPTELIRSTWGNAVATELNTRCIKVNGAIGDGVQPPTNQWITGTFTFNTSGAALRMRRTGDTPFIQFETTAATPVNLGTIQATAAGLIYNAPQTLGQQRFLVAGTERLQVDNTGVDVTGVLDVTGKITAENAVDVNAGGVRIGGNGAQLSLIDTSTSGSDFHDVYINFYGQGVSMVSPGTRSGYVGYGGSTTLGVINSVPNGGVTLSGTGSGAISLTTPTGNIVLDAGGVTTLYSGGVERGRVAGSLLWGKTSGGTATPGVELFESGTIYSTTATNAVANMIIRHNTNTDGASYISFVNASGASVCELYQDTVAPTGVRLSHASIDATSDYRLKNDLGPVVGAVDRVMQLQPKHLAWKENGHEFDGFIAHELAAVVPDAVTGEKDAVYDDVEAERLGLQPGDIKPQGVNIAPVVPLLAAALQELADRVTALEDV